MQRRFHPVLASCFLCFAATFAAPSGAQPYPSKTVRIVVPYLPGGAADTVSRILAQRLTMDWGRTVIVENRPGAAGNIGSELVAKAAPDGYTLLMGTLAHAVNVVLYKKLPYDIVKDFAPVSEIGISPNLLVVHPSLPVKTIKELIALARSKPGELTFGSAGMGSLSHMSGELFNQMANVRIEHIPYKGGPQAIIDVVSGQITMYFSSFPSALVHVHSGRLRGIAVTSSRRSDVVPQLPTIAEAALPGYDLVNWYGILAPAGTPRDVVAKIQESLVKALSAHEVQKQVRDQSIDIIASSPAELADLIQKEIARYRKLAASAHIVAE
jgi:tripartite-type tricarboxylate transporter receptor subunit TctC